MSDFESAKHIIMLVDIENGDAKFINNMYQ